MAPQAEWMWLQAGETVTQAELARMCGLSAAELDELVEYGALVSVSADPAGPAFAADCVGPLRTASRLRADFELDLFTVGLLLGYLHRIEDLERELKTLRAQLPAHHHARGEGPAPWREPHA